MIAWQEPPPYIQYLSEAEQLGRMAVSAGHCAGMDVIESSSGQVEEVTDDFLRRAIIARVDVAMIHAAMNRGITAAEDEWKFMFDLPAGLTQSQRTAREERLVDFVGERCASVVIDYPAVGALREEAPD